MANIVLVHGAWQGAWCWHKVIPLLENAGHKVIAVDLPGHGNDTEAIEDQNLTTYAGYVEKIIRSVNGTVLLVGHSLGGIVITQAAEYCSEKISKLVYVCAFIPEDGRSIDGPTAVRPTDWSELAQKGVVKMSDDGKVTWMQRETATQILAHDLLEEDREHLLSHLGPEAVAAQYEAAHISERFFNIPRVYVRCTNDRSIEIELQDKMIEAAPCVRTYTLDSGHSPFYACPEELAKILNAEAV